MQVPKPTDEDRARLNALVPDQDARVEVKPMFGNIGAFVNGNMFMGLFGPAVGIKLDDAGREELAAVEGAGPFGPEERPMGGFVSVPARWVSESSDDAHRWVQRSLDHVSALPPKAKKPPTR